MLTYLVLVGQKFRAPEHKGDFASQSRPRVEERARTGRRVYEIYHSNSYNAAELDIEIERLRGDAAVESRKGIYEYLLSHQTEPQLLSIRLFDKKTKGIAYEQQTQKAKSKGVSNCPLCAIGDNSNKSRIYTEGEMDADHVTAWSKGGPTDLANCELLCVTHNRAKGSRRHRRWR